MPFHVAVDRKLESSQLACESIRFSFALRRWGRFAKRPQRRRAKEKRMLSQATSQCYQ